VFSDELVHLASDVLAAARVQGVMLATAESCTGGLIAGLLTEIPGSSDVVERGFVTYSNQAKMEMLGVPRDLLDAHGAVSEPVAAAMAEGALAHSRAGLSVAVTGIAGPGGGSPGKPVGLVYIAAMRKGGIVVVQRHLFGDIGRDPVRLATVEAALRLVQTQLINL
jgi:nicotinamide-nucleotide amidase